MGALESRVYTQHSHEIMGKRNMSDKRVDWGSFPIFPDKTPGSKIGNAEATNTSPVHRPVWCVFVGKRRGICRNYVWKGLDVWWRSTVLSILRDFERVVSTIFPQTVCPHWGVLAVGVKAGAWSGCSGPRHFSCKSPYKVALVTCWSVHLECVGSHKVWS